MNFSDPEPLKKENRELNKRNYERAVAELHREFEGRSGLVNRARFRVALLLLRRHYLDLGGWLASWSRSTNSVRD